MSRLHAAIAVVLVTSVCLAQDKKYQANWESLDSRPCPGWFTDAKFGIFVHWGVYSVPAWSPKGMYSEWYWMWMLKKKPVREFHDRVYGKDFEYFDFAPLFKAELFDADQWAAVIASSGARYFIPTSKHHDGYCLWPSAEATRTWGRPWNSMDVAPRRDLLGELSAAMRKKDVRFCFYYSLYEWFNPLYKKDVAQYVAGHMTPQFKDVVTRYKPSLIFADGEWDHPAETWKSQELLAWLFNESPVKDEVVVNDRWGKGTRHKHGSYFTTEYGAGMKDASRPWEENRGMGFSFGYNRAEDLQDYRSARELVLMLCDLVSRGGNLNLDIGPAGDGSIPVIMQQRLAEMGAWLKVNGEAIYGTTTARRECQWTPGTRPRQGYGEFKEKYDLMNMVGQAPRGDKAVKQAFFTRKGDTLYAITAGWPGRRLVLRDIQAPSDAAVTLLGHEGKLACTVEANTLTIEAPDLNVDQAPCRHAYTFKIPGAKLLAEKQP